MNNDKILYNLNYLLKFYDDKALQIWEFGNNNQIINIDIFTGTHMVPVDLKLYKPNKIYVLIKYIDKNDNLEKVNNIVLGKKIIKS